MRRLALLVVTAALAVGLVPVTAGAQQWWQVPAEENVNLPPGLIPYHEIAPKLRDIEVRSNRVQVEVIGQSAEGRDLYLATVSDPSAFGRLGRYKALRELMIRDPARAQELASQFEDFKIPFFVNCSIHGNEWEGVDACLHLIERLAFENDPETRKVLDNNILLFNVVQNPDGRVRGIRQNGNGFDLNRDFVTLSQPEVRATVEQVIEWHPMVLLDLHGYVNPMLIEPTTPPHNPNYEYDLYIKWALAQAEAMEARLAADTGLPAQIPFRDFAEGWDDWPPIFTPMYAMFHGAYGHTLESPTRPTPGLPDAVRFERSQTSLKAHIAAVWGAMQFASDNRQEMVHDQIEVFRRGWLDEPQILIPDNEFPQHHFAAEIPEAYVIPMGDGQRNDVAAVELVNFLLVHDVQVDRAPRPFSFGGTTYPAGSYVVWMAQPKRGLANTFLEPGYDLTPLVDRMFDISAWSHGELWGATVMPVPDGTGLSLNTAPVPQAQSAQGSVPSGRATHYTLLVDGPVAVQAVNRLLDQGVPLMRTDDGRMFVPAAHKTSVQALARELGLDFGAATALPPGAEPVKDVAIAGAMPSDEFFVLTRLGFEVDRITQADMNAGFQLDDYDVLWVSTSLRYATMNAAARAEVDEFLARGGGVVTRGFTGARFNSEASILAAGFTTARSDANGIVIVENRPGSPVVSTGPDRTFVFAALWFHSLGANAQASQRFVEGDFFVAGHWVNQEAAAGQVSVVHGARGDARAVLFATEPLFRAHPRGLFHQAAHALWWAAN